MLDAARKLNDLLNPNLRGFAIIIAIFILFTTLIETLSIGLIFPLVNLIYDASFLNEYPKILSILSKISPLNLFQESLAKIDQQGHIVAGATLAFVILIFLKSIYLIFFAYIKSHFIYKVHLGLTKKYINGYLNQPYSLFYKRKSSDFTRSIVYEIQSLTASIDLLLNLFTELFIAAGITILLLYIQPATAFFMIIIFSTVLLVAYNVTKEKIFHLGENRKDFEEKRLNFMNQILGGIKEVKIYLSEKEFIKSFLSTSSEVFKSSKWISVFQNVPKSVFELVAALCLFFIIITLLSFSKSQSEVISTLALFAAASFRILPSASRILGSLQKVRYYVPTINYLDNENKLLFNKNSFVTEKKYKFNQSIILKNLEFSYNKNHKVLDNVNLIIEKNSSIGLIGKSGSGKSTFANIMTGLLTPSKGEILIDNDVLIKRYINLSNTISYVPQNIFLTPDTIRKNVAFGLSNEEIDENKVYSSLKKAKLESLIESLPKGIETKVGERGSLFSGGQIQRIGIARALYRDPEILILDEATSSLDKETEREFMNLIQGMSKDLTLIIISHNFDLIKFCDKKFEINSGKFIEKK